MKLIAITTDGMHQYTEVPVNQIAVWVGKEVYHKVSKDTIEALLAENKKSKQMQIYAWEDSPSYGKIDAFNGTPLYTNGQKNVGALILDDKLIWESFEGHYSKFMDKKTSPEDELISLIEKELENPCKTNLPTLCEFVKTDEGKQTATRMIFDYCLNNGVSVQTAMAHIDTEL